MISLRKNFSIIITNERKKSNFTRLDIVVVSVLANEKENIDVNRKSVQIKWQKMLVDYHFYFKKEIGNKEISLK